MGMQAWIQKLIPVEDLKDTIKRFPLSVACALILFIIAIALTHEFWDDANELLGRFSVTIGCLYFWFGIVKLMAESQKWSAVKHYTIGFVVAGGMASLFMLTEVWGMPLMFVIPALLLSLMVAPYWKGGDDLSFWFFNRCMWFGVIVSYAALIMFAGGLSIALGAIHTLFEVRIDSKVYVDIWIFASLVLGPLYALSWVPERFEFTEEDCNDPPGLQFIMNWISAPMVFVYLMILYAYFGKIILTGEVPNGHLAYMISGFVGVGVITYLTSFPLRDVGALQLKLFHKIFFPALLIPVGFHFYAIWERVSAYGITEQRYMLLLSAIWFVIIAIGNTMSKMPLRAIPMTLAILMVFGAFGPWGGVSVSGYSQVSRLEIFLNRNNLLENGKVVKAETDLSRNDRKNISSMLQYICSHQHDAKIEPWFNVEGKKNWNCNAYDLTKQLGFDFVGHYESFNENNRFSLNRGRYDDFMDVSGYNTMIKGVNVYFYGTADKKPWSKEFKSANFKTIKIESYKKEGLVKVLVDGSEVISFDVNAFAKEHASRNKNDHDDLFYFDENENIRAEFYFTNIHGQIEGEDYIVDNMNFDFLYTLK